MGLWHNYIMDYFCYSLELMLQLKDKQTLYLVEKMEVDTGCIFVVFSWFQKRILRRR